MQLQGIMRDEISRVSCVNRTCHEQHPIECFSAAVSYAISAAQ